MDDASPSTKAFREYEEFLFFFTSLRLRVFAFYFSYEDFRVTYLTNSIRRVAVKSPARRW
jgi:hypothetical protein